MNNTIDYYNENAKKFIFPEYFIIEEGEMFNSILDILKEKGALCIEREIFTPTYEYFRHARYCKNNKCTIKR